MRIILIGCGAVGQSFLKLISGREKEMLKNYGFRPKIVAVSDSRGAAFSPKGLDLEKVLASKEKYGTVGRLAEYGHESLTAADLINSAEAEVVIETTPTNIKDGEPGLSNIKAAFKNGKNVITTNKGPLALALPALMELADYNQVCLRFSGTVGGGTPILDVAKKCLLGDRITAIRGILNGTTNYILTEMDEKRISFRQALEDARKKGYAEANPSMDVDGVDAACKLVILANWIMNRKVTLRDVDIRGISGVTQKDLQNASKAGKTIKLIGEIDGGLKVAPKEISRRDPLCVSGVLNAVTFVSEFAGEETIVGRGAGGVETASAVLRDLISIKQNLAEKLLD